MKIYKVQKDDFIISTDKSKIDIVAVHNYLCNESYWAKNIPIDVVKKSIEGSCCFGLYNKKLSGKYFFHSFDSEIVFIT